MAVTRNFFDFVDWLKDEIKAGRLKRSAIANTKLVSRSAVTNLFNRTTKSLSDKMANALSIAMRMEKEDIYIKLGRIKSKPNMQDPWIKKMLTKLQHIPPKWRDHVERAIDAFTITDQDE